MISGSDRNCDYWKQDYHINGSDELSLHHFYRAMSFLGEEVSDQTKASPFSKRRIKDIIEEELFFARSDLFSGLEMVFFDTTSIHFEGEGGSLAAKGHSKSHRPDLNQMVIGVLMSNNGMPLCCEMWPGNTADITTFLPIIESIKKRFGVHDFCIVADRGMISQKSLAALEAPDSRVKYILGVKMRQEKAVKTEVLSRSGRYKDVFIENKHNKATAHLRVKEVKNDGTRYIVCLNTKQADKDRHDRKTILESLEEKLKLAPGKLIGNKGYRKYLKVNKQSMAIDYTKIQDEERYDGKWVLRTNTDLPADEVALRYKELWMIERIFRDMKSLLETRPIYHQNSSSICGHIFCSFLSLTLIKELESRLERSGIDYEWDRLVLDLKSLKEFTMEKNGKRFAVRTECRGISGKVFQSVGIAIPPTIKEL